MKRLKMLALGVVILLIAGLSTLSVWATGPPYALKERTKAFIKTVPPVQKVLFIIEKTSSADLTSAPLSYTTDFAAKVRVRSITGAASEAITETVVAQINYANATYNVDVFRVELVAEQDVFFTSDGLILESGDELVITCSNDNATGVFEVLVKGEDIS